MAAIGVRKSTAVQQCIFGLKTSMIWRDYNGTGVSNSNTEQAFGVNSFDTLGHSLNAAGEKDAFRTHNVAANLRVSNAPDPGP